MPSWSSSQAVSRAPWSHGRVSPAKTAHFFPPWSAARTTPRAVPYPAVASPPALQWVRIPLPSGTSCAPNRPMALHAARSSSSTRSASALSAAKVRGCTSESRSKDQRRFTAVGRASSKACRAVSNSSAASAESASP